MTLYGQWLLTSTSSKYLGLINDKRRTWREDMEIKRKKLRLRFSQLYWLLKSRSHLSLKNKLLIYKTILRPIQILKLFKPSKNKYFALYVRNDRGLTMPTVKETFDEFSSRYLSRLESLDNVLSKFSCCIFNNKTDSK